MAEQEETPDAAEKPKRSLMLPISLVLGLLLGGGAFYAVYSGVILGQNTQTHAEDDHAEETEEVAFVPIEAITVSLGRTQLRFNAQLEVDPKHSDEVTHLMPRVLDILNGYLRALDTAQLEDPAALIRIRAQMLRRVQLVTGKGNVRDLLITEFIFS